MSHLYSIQIYFFGKLAHYITVGIFVSLLNSIIVYFAIGLNIESAERFFVFWGVMFMIFFNSIGKGLIATAMFDKIEAAFAFTPALFVPFLLFAGLLINNDNYPDYIFYVKYISDAQYTYGALILNEFEHLELNCEKQFEIFCKDPAGSFNFQFNLGINILLGYILGGVTCFIAFLLYLKNFKIYRK